MKLKFTLWSLASSLILVTGHLHASQQEQRRPDLTFVYSNDVLGEIEPCG